MPKSNVTVQNNIPEIVEAFTVKCEESLTRGTYLIHGEVVETLSGSRTGRTYQIPGSEVTYTASAPGEPPASRLGDLRTDYKPKVEGKGMQAVGYVGSRLPYSTMLEKGTKNMAPRPHLRPSFDKVKKDVINQFKGLVT